MFSRIAPLAGMLAFALLAQPVPAQTLYKSITPDGRTVYSDKPPPDAVKTEKRALDTSKAGVTAPSAREKDALRQMESDRKVRESAQERIRKAEIALHDAQVARDMGKESQPNERLGTVGGGQRFTDTYWARQKKLEESVESAQRNLEKVRSGK